MKREVIPCCVYGIVELILYLLGVICECDLPPDITHLSNFTHGDQIMIYGILPGNAWAVARESSSNASCRGRIIIGHVKNAKPFRVISIVCLSKTDCCALFTISYR